MRTKCVHNKTCCSLEMAMKQGDSSDLFAAAWPRPLLLPSKLSLPLCCQSLLAAVILQAAAGAAVLISLLSKVTINEVAICLSLQHLDRQ